MLDAAEQCEHLVARVIAFAAAVRAAAGAHRRLGLPHAVGLGDLAGTIESFVHAFFGREVETRLRPSYFPFTEPSAEFDISRPDGSWLELGGCGVVNPNVLANCGIDPEEWQGFAFGFGIDRMAKMKFGVDDLRDMYSNDIRFLRQF